MKGDEGRKGVRMPEEKTWKIKKRFFLEPGAQGRGAGREKYIRGKRRRGGRGTSKSVH